jgi:hypothetical protein
MRTGRTPSAAADVSALAIGPGPGWVVERKQKSTRASFIIRQIQRPDGAILVRAAASVINSTSVRLGRMLVHLRGHVLPVLPPH